MVNTARMTLLVLYSERMEECRAFYTRLGLAFDREQHGKGAEHYAAALPDGMVIELYPGSPERRTGAARLGFSVDGATLDPPLEPGRHLLADPDGRKVELHA
ncbi:hypothetical protein CLV63_12677 [Murinocardiopsis flavida]|uniref:Uncharacterized protein n=1 Tax=Murinocardiopsis flavida TaxID=645275 RepID=A0A2P8CWU8_9ACTN|nr:glyoxalase/bleomycin resistance/dioxygenase family protein [Murinocardiopsis flavida]PSK89441.1 hypothetical protein CLV63_12677 [Murinocardiopsis flavida]